MTTELATTELAQIEKPLRDYAARAAGRPEDLVHRATTYVRLYQHSGRNFGFPLLAAHGALWGSIHFKRGAFIGDIASAALGREEKARRRKAIQELAAAFKEINRRVCVETVTFYHLSARAVGVHQLEPFMPAALADALLECHVARRLGRRLDTDRRRRLFTAFFRWEQDKIVGPAVCEAFDRFDWDLMRPLVLRPPVGFRYFGPLTWLWFKDFSDTSERIAKGLRAFELAENVGWETVEKRVMAYRILPKGLSSESSSGVGDWEISLSG